MPPMIQVLKHANARFPKKSPFLQQLRFVRLLEMPRSSRWLSRDYAECDLLRRLRLFHRLPSIESLRAEAIYSNPLDREDCFLTPAVSNVKKLHIGHSCVSDVLLCQAIRHSKTLEELICTTSGRRYQCSSSMDPIRVGKELTQTQLKSSSSGIRSRCGCNDRKVCRARRAKRAA